MVLSEYDGGGNGKGGRRMLNMCKLNPNNFSWFPKSRVVSDHISTLDSKEISGHKQDWKIRKMFQRNLLVNNFCIVVKSWQDSNSTWGNFYFIAKRILNGMKLKSYVHFLESEPTEHKGALSRLHY